MSISRSSAGKASTMDIKPQMTPQPPAGVAKGEQLPTSIIVAEVPVRELDQLPFFPDINEPGINKVAAFRDKLQLAETTWEMVKGHLRHREFCCPNGKGFSSSPLITLPNVP
jgi:hypothetical protein